MLRIGNFDLYYEVHGEGYPVVFAHGVGGNHASWYHQVAALSGRYRCIVFDHRGFGNSWDEAGGPGRARFVPDLLALFDHLNLEQAAVVAQSMGGGTCAHFTWKHPKRVKSLVLADTLVGLNLPPAIRERVSAVDKSMDGRTQLERVLGETFRKRDPAGRELYAAIASFNQVNRKTLAGTLGEGPTPEDLAGTGVPILFLVGNEDALYPPGIVHDVQKMVRGSRYVELPDAGHSAYFENPKAFNDAVGRFLDETAK